MSAERNQMFVDKIIGESDPLPITRLIQQFPHARTPCRTANALISMPALEEPLPHLKDFGWYWHETEELRFLAKELFRRNIEFNVWQSAQVAAVEWLLDCDRLPAPAEFDDAMHGLFCRIMSLRILEEGDALESDLALALEKVSDASKLHQEAYDKISTIRPEVLRLLQLGPQNSSLSTEQVNSISGAAAMQFGVMKAAIEAELRHRREISARLVGSDANKIRGAKRKWLPDYCTLLAADIFLTAGFNRERATKGGKSFKTFLDHFCEDVPNASTADKPALARKFWYGDGGSSFAPPENCLSRLRGKNQPAS